MSRKAYPYQTLYGKADLVIDEVLIDGLDDRTDSLTKFDKRSVNLFDCPEEDWGDVEIKVKATHPASALKEDLEIDPSDLGLTAVARCTDTNARQTVALELIENGDQVEWSGRMVLDRRDYRGKVELESIISGEVNGTPHRFLGESKRWILWFDQPPAHSITGNINVKWKDFSDPDESPDLTELEDETFYLDLESDPTLFLNQSFDGLPDLLESESKEDPHEVAFRESEFYGIARAVWLAMFNAAASSISKKSGQHIFPEREWKEKVLKKMLPRLLPESSEEDALRQVHESFRGETSPWIQSKALTVADRLTEASAALRSSLEKIEQRSNQ